MSRGYGADPAEDKEYELELDDDERRRIDSLPEIQREQEYDRLFQKQREKRLRNQLLSSEFQKKPEVPQYDEDYDDIKPSRRRRRRHHSSSDEERPVKRRRIAKDRVEIPIEPQKPKGAITLEDIEKIRVSRTNLAKWVGHLHCDKTVTGSFVKVNIGKNTSKENQYLMCEVAAIK